MKVYVAGRTTMIEEVREVQDYLSRNQCTITHDWTLTVEANRVIYEDWDNIPDDVKLECAARDLKGVLDADFVVAVAGPDWLGTAMEVGMALAWDTPVIVYGELPRATVFTHLPGVLEIYADLDQLGRAVEWVRDRINTRVDRLAR